jgi:hypothetical protein
MESTACHAQAHTNTTSVDSGVRSLMACPHSPPLRGSGDRRAQMTSGYEILPEP